MLDEYAQLVRDKSVLREVNDQYVEITTPYLVRRSDYTQIYARRDNGGFMLTDGGETIQDRRASGCDLETSKRRDLLTSTLTAYSFGGMATRCSSEQRRRTSLYERTIWFRRFWR